MTHIKQTAYLIPFSEEGLEDAFFLPYKDSEANVPPFPYLRNYLEEHGVAIHTIDRWNKGSAHRDDVLIVFDHPPVGMYRLLYTLRRLAGKKSFYLKTERIGEFLRAFRRRILFLWESPVNTPWMYGSFGSIAKLYDAVHSIPRVQGAEKFYYPQNFSSYDAKRFERPRERFMMFMNAPHTAKGYFKQELYRERVRALEFFGARGDIDIYGKGWESFGSQNISRNACGKAGVKADVVSRYTFSLCFENAIWPGYVTEKIFDAMLVGTIPVYLGAPDIERDVPPECFVDVRKFGVSPGRVNYEKLGAFLHAMTPEEIQVCREAIRAYFGSPTFNKFTPRSFSEGILRAIRG